MEKLYSCYDKLRLTIINVDNLQNYEEIEALTECWHNFLLISLICLLLRFMEDVEWQNMLWIPDQFSLAYSKKWVTNLFEVRQTIWLELDLEDYAEFDCYLVADSFA